LVGNDAVLTNVDGAVAILEQLEAGEVADDDVKVESVPD